MINEAYKRFTDAKLGDRYSRPLLLETVKAETARTGKPYLKLTLFDGFSKQTVNLWNTTPDDLKKMNVKSSSLVDVDLSVSEYQGGLSFDLKGIAPTADPEADITDYIKLPPVDIDTMFDEILDAVNSSADDLGGKCEPLAGLAAAILGKHEADYKRSSASVFMHHDLRGGLLYHSYRMVKAAEALCSVYPALDRELLICGAALHDIGKIWEYKTSETGSAELTAGGVLFGHLYMGASLIKGFTADHSYSTEKVQLLTHLILSHHGIKEWGAVALPAIPEAMMLHHIDDIDAKMYMFESNYETLAPGAMTAKNVFGIDTRVYKPKYK